MKNIFPLLAAVFLLVACAPSKQSVQTAIAGTQTAWTAIPSQTPNPTNTPLPSHTPLPKYKPIPSSTPIATKIPNGDQFAWNYIASQESGGLLVEITRLSIADKNAVSQNFSDYSIFDDKPVVGEFVLKMTNNSDKVISIYPDQGIVVIGSEQIELDEYMFVNTVGDDLGGDIYPGVTKIGVIWFGIKRSAVKDILSLTFTFNRPIDANWNDLGDDFNFIIDLSERKNDPIPDELK